MAWRAAGKPDLAADAMQHASELAPLEASPLYGLGLAEASRNQTGKSIDTLRKLLTLEPESAAAQNNLGNILSRAGDIKGAEAAFREAVRLQPELPALHINLANLLAQNGKPAAARFEYEEAIRIGPSSEIAQSAWFVALRKTGDPEAARRIYERSRRLQMLEAHNNLGNVFLTLSDPGAAIREFRNAADADPLSAMALVNLGVTLAAHSEPGEAKLKLLEAVRIDPKSRTTLQQAAEATDPKVRAVATEVLRALK
jgi:Flp pilus assembly protein TadD